MSADQFVFELDQSVGRMTRSRRSSISSINQEPAVKPKAKSRRQTMMPTISETKAVSPKKKTTKAIAVSPTKKISKSSAKTLKEEDILSKLDTSDPKPFPVKKIIASKVAAAKKSPVKSRIPVKSPPSAKKETQVRRSRRVSGDAASLAPAPAVKPSKRRQTMLPAISEAITSPAKSPVKKATKTPAKKASKTPAKKAPRSPVKSPVDVVKEVKKVEIKLKQMKVKEDPNLIYNLLEESVGQHDRVSAVVDRIIKEKKDASPVTRQRKVNEKKSPKKEQKPAVKTPKVESKATPKVVPKATPVTASKKRKQTESAVVTPVQNKRLKLDKSANKTPGSDKKSTKVTPTLVTKYKQRTPGSLKKPLKRLNAAKNTPAAQVRPADVLRRNMIKKVEKQIVQKLSNRPDSSPYTLKSTENSPVFTKVSPVKTHITGTPARTMPRRKFGTVIQPQSLLEESVAPGTEMLKRVSSSTPLRQRQTDDPHPLESVEATPIRPPTLRQPPMSPPPQMITGKLGNLCSIM